MPKNVYNLTVYSRLKARLNSERLNDRMLSLLLFVCNDGIFFLEM
jgi:hypothetical protein